MTEITEGNRLLEAARKLLTEVPEQRALSVWMADLAIAELTAYRTRVIEAIAKVEAMIEPRSSRDSSNVIYAGPNWVINVLRTELALNETVTDRDGSEDESK